MARDEALVPAGERDDPGAADVQVAAVQQRVRPVLIEQRREGGSVAGLDAVGEAAR